MSSTKLIVAIVALTGALGAGAAQARGNDDMQWSVTIGAPAAVFVHDQPYPAYRQPAPRTQRDHYQQPTRWDRDGDGIPNRYDRVYNPRWDRDGDGIPNRYDRRDNLRHDRDGDGIPNWRDNHNGDGRGWDR